MAFDPIMDARKMSSLLNLVPAKSQTSYTSLPCQRELLFSVVVDNHCPIRGEPMAKPTGAIKFPIDLINLIVHPQTDQSSNTVVVLYGEAKYANTEWACTTQMRIKTGTANRKEPIRLVDKGLFRIGKWLPPITVRVTDKQVKRIKLEFKFVNQQFEYLPRFEIGDVTLKFKDGTLCADKALLAMHSRYMASFLHDAAQGAVIDMGGFEMEPFRELLYQIYATRRPIETDLAKIALAANAFKADIILSKLTTHIFALDMDLIQKVQLALALELDQTLSELVYVAEQRGVWTHLIEEGFEPKSLGNEIYQQIICPSVVKGKSRPYGTPLQPTWNSFTFTVAQPPFTVPLVVEGQTFHVNRGIMEIHNTKGYTVGDHGGVGKPTKRHRLIRNRHATEAPSVFTDRAVGCSRPNSSELIVRCTPLIKETCEASGVTMPKLVEYALRHIYPSRIILPGRLFKPLMAFAEEHSLRRLLNSLGEMALMEPPTSPEQMLEQLQLANRYQHGNFFRACLLRIEGSFKSRASELIAMEEFQQLPEAVREEIFDRHCSGWALKDQHLAGLPTERIVREVTLTKGWARPTERSERGLRPLEEMKSVEAFGSAHDMKMTS